MINEAEQYRPTPRGLKIPMKTFVYLAVAFCTLSAYSTLTLAHAPAVTERMQVSPSHHHCRNGVHSKFGREHHGLHAHALHWRLLKGLHLTPAQMTQIRAAIKTRHTEGRALIQQVRDHRHALATTSPLASNYPELVAAVKADDAARIDQNVRLRTAVFSALTLKQQAQLLKRLETRRVKHAGHARFRGHGHHHHREFQPTHR
jgi:Spy/CpxP family protein refolding chaperone